MPSAVVTMQKSTSGRAVTGSALDGDAAAVDTLTKLLVRPCGPDNVRLDLELWLQQNFFIDADQAQKLLLCGEVQEATVCPMALHSNQRDPGLPAALQTRLQQMHRLLKKKDLHGALRLAEALAAAHPGHPTLVANIAHVKEALGHDIDEIEALFQRVKPSNWVAPSGHLRRVGEQGKNHRACMTPLPTSQAFYHFMQTRQKAK